MINQNIHIVERKETISTIAEKYNIPSEKILINYHNQNCELKDLIAPNINLKKGRSIIIPTEEEIKKILNKSQLTHQQNKDKQISRLANNDIIFPFLHTQHEYLLESSIHTEKNQKSIKRDFTHLVSIMYKQKDKENYILEYSKKVNTLNQKNFFSKVQELAIFCDKKNYPMQWVVSPDAHIVTIKNILEIRKNWRLSIPKLKEYYTGEFFLEYIRAHEKKVMSSNALLQSILQDYMISTYFSVYLKKFNDYKNSFKKNYGDHEIGFKVEQEIQNDEKDLPYIIIKQTGKSLKNQKNTLQISNGYTFIPSGTMKAEISLDKKYHYIYSIKAEFNLQISPHKKEIFVFELTKI